MTTLTSVCNKDCGKVSGAAQHSAVLKESQTIKNNHVSSQVDIGKGKRLRSCAKNLHRRGFLKWHSFLLLSVVETKLRLGCIKS